MVNVHGRFAWYELATTDVAAAGDLLRQGHGMGGAGRFGAGQDVCGVYRRERPDRRLDGSAGGHEWNGRKPELARICPGRRRGRRRRPSQAARRRRAHPADRRSRHQPLLDLRRPASRQAGVDQVAETRPGAIRAGRAGPRRLARAARRRLGTVAGLLSRAVRLAESRRRCRGDGHLSAVFRRRGDDRRHAHQAFGNPGPFLALLFQRRRPRRRGAARDGRGAGSSTARSRCRAAAGSSSARTLREPCSRWRERAAARRSAISSGCHRAILPTRAAGDGPGSPAQRAAR